MLVGEHKGKGVQDAKPLVRKMLLDNNQAAAYYEPESEVVSRSGEQCIVALCDQWYLNYGDPVIQEKLRNYLQSSAFESYNSSVRHSIIEAVNWLKQWGCSRSFGLGSKLPFDEKYLVESLSDSTIYMAYYTVSHFLQGNIDGSKAGSLDIKVDDLAICDWNYIFLKKSEYSADSKIPKEKLDKCRESFRYWYPLDFRTTGKDLMKNHMTMTLYNHAVIWDDEDLDMLPRSYFANGWVLVDKEKMAKSKGNFITLQDMTEQFGADASRISMCNGGDTLSDANIAMKEIDQAILNLAALEEMIKTTCKNLPVLRTESPDEVEFFDQVFTNEIKRTVNDYCKDFDRLVLRDVLKHCFFVFINNREQYTINCGSHGMKRDIAIEYIKTQLTLVYPIAPHFCEIMWTDYFYPALTEEQKQGVPEICSQARIDTIPEKSIDKTTLNKMLYLTKLAKSLRTNLDKFKQQKTKNKAKAKDTTPLVVKVCNILVCREYKEFHMKILDLLRGVEWDSDKKPIGDWKKLVKDSITDGKVLKQAFAFANEIIV